MDPYRSALGQDEIQRHLLHTLLAAFRQTIPEVFPDSSTTGKSSTAPETRKFSKSRTVGGDGKARWSPPPGQSMTLYGRQQTASLECPEKGLVRPQK